MSTATALSPSEIFAEIESHPPLMRPEAVKRYLGKEVSWPVVYRNAYEISSGDVRLLFASEPNTVQMIMGTVALSEYPQLRHLRTAEVVRVQGTIQKIDTLSIELNIRDLIFTKAAEAASKKRLQRIR